MRKAYIFLVALIVWAGLFWYHYIYSLKKLGSPLPTTSTVIPAPPASPSANDVAQQILFKPNDYLIFPTTGLTTLIDSILAQEKAGEYLKITGLHTRKEAQGMGFDLAWARASELKKLLIDRLPEDRIELYSDTISNFTYVADSLIEAVTYEWVAGYEPTAIPTDDYYLLDHDSKRVRVTDFEPLLTSIGERLVKTGEKIIIKGHTDTDGDKELNFTIGLRNAKDIRDFLKELGVPHQQITTTTRGEEAPIADNETEIGKRKNRRIEIEIGN